MSTEKNLGEKIKSLRESRKLSVDELSANCGISNEQIESIESNKSLPSLSPLIKIARALGVRLGTFLDGETELGPAVSRAKKQTESIRFSESKKNDNGCLDFYSLAEHKPGRNMEPFFIDVFPNKTELPKPSSHEGEEFIYVLQGKLNIQYGSKEYVLEQGDSIYYDSIVEHLVYNVNDELCKILAVVYAPF